jgi:hypothetical protein
MTCFKCNEEGHMSRECPSGGGGSGGFGGRGGGRGRNKIIDIFFRTITVVFRANLKKQSKAEKIT